MVVAAAAKSRQLCPTLWHPIDGSPAGFPILGILQARTLEWIAVSSFRGSSPPEDRTHIPNVSCISGRNGLLQKRINSSVCSFIHQGIFIIYYLCSRHWVILVNLTMVKLAMIFAVITHIAYYGKTDNGSNKRLSVMRR